MTLEAKDVDVCCYRLWQTCASMAVIARRAGQMRTGSLSRDAEDSRYFARPLWGPHSTDEAVPCAGQVFQPQGRKTYVELLLLLKPIDDLAAVHLTFLILYGDYPIGAATVLRP